VWRGGKKRRNKSREWVGVERRGGNGEGGVVDNPLWSNGGVGLGQKTKPDKLRFRGKDITEGLC